MNPLEVRALAALVKASQPIAVPFAKKAATLLGKLLGPAATALGERLGEFLAPPTPIAPTVLDMIAMWRHGNMTVVLGRAAERLEGRGIEPRPIPIGALLPLLEAASLVDDDTLREWWAELLASGVSADEHQHPMWVKILAQMSGEDAREFQRASARTDARGIPYVGGRDQFHGIIEASSPAEARLLALGLVTPMTSDELDEDSITTALSQAGAQFRRAVMPRETPRPSI